MADYLGEVATAVAAGGLSNKVLSGLIDGRTKVMVESYTILGTEASASTITLGGIMPKGARVLAIQLYVSAAQTSATFDVGDDEDADRYAAASTSLQSAGTYIFSGKNYITDDTTPTSTDRQIVLTTGGATLTAGTLEAVIYFTID